MRRVGREAGWKIGGGGRIVGCQCEVVQTEISDLGVFV